MARLDSSVFPSLNDEVVSKLHSLNIFTVYDFMLQKRDELMRKTGLTFKEIEETRELFFAKFGGEAANTAELYERELKHEIPTGIQNLDALLQGGLRFGTIYEICGSSSAGKSQLCHWLSMHATLSASVEVHYIDASGNFCASRIQMMLDSRHCSDNTIGHVMSSIKVYQICKIYELFSVLHDLSNALTTDRSESPKRLIIVDSLSALCAIISNMELNPHLCNVASMCRYIVDHSESAVLIVNTIRSRQEGTFLAEREADAKFTLKIRPSLGNYWLNVPNVRLLMTHDDNGRRKITVWKSHQLECDKCCLVRIKDEGVFPSR